MNDNFLHGGEDKLAKTHREAEAQSMDEFRKALSPGLAKNHLTGDPIIPPEVVKAAEMSEKAERKVAKKARKAEKKAMKKAAKRSRWGTNGAVQKSADAGEMERLRRENELLREAMSV